jgi:hypothetical protein
MSAVGTIATFATKVAGRTLHVVRHPVQSAAHVAGAARGVAGKVIDGGHQDVGAPGGPPGADQAPPTATNARPAPPRRPATPPDPVTTEPSAPSRNAAHGGPGDDRFDDLADEIGEDPDVETPVGTTGAGEGYNPDTTETGLQQPGTEPLMDASLTKAIKSEADTLRKAADPEKG